MKTIRLLQPMLFIYLRNRDSFYLACTSIFQIFFLSSSILHIFFIVRHFFTHYLLHCCMKASIHAYSCHNVNIMKCFYFKINCPYMLFTCMYTYLLYVYQSRLTSVLSFIIITFQSLLLRVDSEKKSLQTLNFFV